MFRLLGKTNIDFIGLRRFSFVLSTILVIVGLIAFVSIVLGKAKMGIDFTGGLMIQGSFDQPVDIGDLRTTLAQGGFQDATIQELKAQGMQNAFLIRAKTKEGAGETITMETVNTILGMIDKAFPENKFHKDSHHIIGALVGKDLRNAAIKAILVAVAGILIYIWFRFDFRSGVAATVATFHDVLSVLGIFWVFGIEIDLLVITGLLTLAGYSLTDTVVVYDRIRENLKLFRKKGDFVTTINTSINEVLSRTIITAMTVLLVLISLLLFGGQVLFSFSLALFIGVIIGTYSSVFVASPIVVEWEARSPKRFK